MILLTGKVAAVTGATSGIGLVCCKAFIEAGAKVVLIHYSAVKLEAACKQLGPDAMSVVVDVTDPGNVAQMVPSIVEKAGGLDIFVANAGRFIAGSVAEGDPNAWSKMVDVNVNAVHSTVQAAVKYMIEKKIGDIVVTSSIAADIHFGLCPIYCATKAAVEMFVASLRQQIAGNGVRIATILPGPVETKILDDWPADKLEEARSSGPLLLAENVADCIVFMVSRPQSMAVTKLIVMPASWAV